MSIVSNDSFITFRLVNGLCNQFISLYCALKIANITGRFLVTFNGLAKDYDRGNITIPLSHAIDYDHLQYVLLPKLNFSSYLKVFEDRHSLQPTLPSSLPPAKIVSFYQGDGSQVKWLGVLSIENYLAQITADKYRNATRLSAAAPFSPAYYDESKLFFNELQFSKRMIRIADSIISEIALHNSSYGAIHLRLEDDFLNFFLPSLGSYAILSRNDLYSMLGSMLFVNILTKLKEFAVPLDAHMFLATSLGKATHHNNFLLKIFHKLFPHSKTVSSKIMRHYLGDDYGRETAALVEFIMCDKAKKFTIGINPSTFSMMLLMRAWHKGGDNAYAEYIDDVGEYLSSDTFNIKEAVSAYANVTWSPRMAERFYLSNLTWFQFRRWEKHGRHHRQKSSSIHL